MNLYNGCLGCQHYTFDGKCPAFPMGKIPLDIVGGQREHTFLHPAQTGLQLWEPRTVVKDVEIRRQLTESMGKSAQPRGDAGIDQVPPEKLVELVIKSVYEGDDTRPGGTKILGISNIQIGTPPGGWSCTAEIEDPQGRETLQVQFDGEKYSDWVQGFGPENEVEDEIAPQDDRMDAADTYTPPDEDDTDPKPWPL